MKSMPPLFRAQSLAQQAYHTIRRAIRDGQIPQGEFFSETTFAEMLGVSRTPVREAMLDLFREGVVEIIAKRGFRLAVLDDNAIIEVRMLRVALESLVIRRLCEVATKEDIVELRKVLAGEATEDDDIFSVDEAFHMRMAEIAGLHQVKRILLGVRGKMYLIASGAHVAQPRTDQVVDEHSELLDLISQKDCQAAVDAVTAHVERSIDAFLAARDNSPATR